MSGAFCSGSLACPNSNPRNPSLLKRYHVLTARHAILCAGLRLQRRELDRASAKKRRAIARKAARAR